jgi:hypothetical protein
MTKSGPACHKFVSDARARKKQASHQGFANIGSRAAHGRIVRSGDADHGSAAQLAAIGHI